MIYIASDHAGYHLKKDLLEYLIKKLELQVEDLGPTQYDEKDDFVDFAAALAKKTADDPNNRGILLCSSGHGMCIAANKIKGIRAIIGYSISGVELGRQHNDANVLCLAARTLSKDHAEAITKKFLDTQFKDEEKYIRRIEKISALEY
ncbi:MAG: RpiB/LacA/LacB family sugar-phosphate isomerase [Candidatus Magasanikbacteria bacterium]|nr:RpiB/LacA/LacB family sugar-phosphate isomerase [Candidatus Magasanikbacteria bacterium]